MGLRLRTQKRGIRADTEWFELTGESKDPVGGRYRLITPGIPRRSAGELSVS